MTECVQMTEGGGILPVGLHWISRDEVIHNECASTVYKRRYVASRNEDTILALNFLSFGGASCELYLDEYLPLWHPRMNRVLYLRHD